MVSDMSHRIALVLHENAMLFEVAIAAEIFGVDRADLSPSGEWYDFTIITADGAPHPWLPTLPSAPYEDLEHFDTVVVPSTDDPQADPHPLLLEALRRAHIRGALTASLCTGAFVLAAAGLLDGRGATTHWMHAADLAQRYPRIDVQSAVLYVDEGDVLTSAGKSAALDLCLHLVRRDFGASTANDLARRLVAPAHRTGGQAQFITPPPDPPGQKGLELTLAWARARLDQPLTVTDLAKHAGLSPRQFARRMHAELQAAPLQWLHEQRIIRARDLLERTDASIERIAIESGLGTPATLRRHFGRTVNVTPTAYRASFQAR